MQSCVEDNNQFLVGQTQRTISPTIHMSKPIPDSHQQSIQDNDSSSTWQFTDYIYPITSTAHNLCNYLSLLTQTFPDYLIQLQIQFESFQTFHQFEKKLQQYYEISRGQKIIDKNEFMYQWQQIYMKTRATNRSVYVQRKLYRVTFGHPIQLTIFYKTFSTRLQRLQHQYNYLILPFYKQLRVYLMDSRDDKISSFFIAQFIQMKKSLRVYIEERTQMYELVKYSKLAQRKLLKENVQFLILARSRHVAFYSIVEKSVTKIKAIVRRVLAYHVSLLKFPQINIDQYILCEIVKLIVRELKPVIKEVNDRYEMPVEVDVEQAVIVINDLHEVFVDGVKKLEQELWLTKIVEIQCKEMMLLRRILLNPIYKELFKYEVKYRKCFIIFGKLPEGNRQRIRHKRLLTQLLEEMTDCFTSMYTIVIHTMHLYNNIERLREQTERVVMLASVYGLNVVTYHRVTRMDGFYKVVVEPKELNQYGGKERAGKLMKMLEGYVSGEDVVGKQLMKSDWCLLEICRQGNGLPNQPIQTPIMDKTQFTALQWFSQQQQQQQSN